MTPLRAIVITRLRKEARLIWYVCAASAVVAFLQPHAILSTVRDPFAADIATRTAWIAGLIFFGTLTGIVAAIAQRGAGRLRELELCEQSAPLYGRELARATALVPCIVVTIGSFVYWFVQFVTGFAAPPVFFLLAVAAVNASTLVALSATLRGGAARYLYIAFAWITAMISYVLAIYVDTLRPPPRSLGHYTDILGVASELIFCAVIGFIALRQYGEALARYDPLPHVASEMRTP
ncbi:MAG: hypothetical protein ACXWNJ_05985 [Vulcanimicrobiaceae bacterium]